MRKLLAVIDYQKDFVDGAHGFAKARTLDAGIAKKVQDYLASGDQVLFTYDTHDKNEFQSHEGEVLEVPHCIKESEGWRLYGKTQDVQSCTCQTRQIYEIEKESFGMSPNALDRFGKTLGEVKEIEVIGILTNMCVLTNAIMLQSQWPQAQITVDAKLCASTDDSLHEKALDVMESMQIKVVNR